MSKPSFWRQFKVIVLNMPDDEIPSIKDRLLGKKPAPKTSSQSWDNVLASASTNNTHAAESPSQLWEPAPKAHGKRSAWKSIFRWALIAVLALFCWIGLRTAIWGSNDAAEQQTTPLTATYPTERASAVAQRFTTAYLTYEEGKEDQRAAALSPYYSGGEASGKLGWDGKGKQNAYNVTVYQVKPLDEQKSRVTVLSDVTSGKAKNTVALEMTVIVTDTGAAVYGTPGYVGLPTPPSADATEPVSNDSDLTATTKPSAEEFFAAYAQNDTLDSVTAPGARITGLNGAVKNAKLTKWSVETGGDTERKAWATVTYQSNGATLTNSYQLKLVKVSGGESAKWQIKEIKGS